MGNNTKDSEGATIGGIHFPNLNQIFRHHPARPAPRTGPTAEPAAASPGAVGKYVKYFSAGAICATITHVYLNLLER
jgi:hypothetical protein